MCYETASGPEIHMLDPENIDAEEVKINQWMLGSKLSADKIAHIQITPRTTSGGES